MATSMRFDKKGFERSFKKPEYGKYAPVLRQHREYVVRLLQKKQKISVDISCLFEEKPPPVKQISYIRTSGSLGKIVNAKFFLRACEIGKLKTVQTILEEEPDIAKRAFTFSRGRSGLHKAAEANNAEIVEVLLGKGGADVNCIEHTENDTPLHLCARENAVQAAVSLVKSCPDTSIK